MPEAIGTGFFVDPRYLLTCAHIVGNGESQETLVEVLWDGQTSTASIVELLPAPYPDLALLQLHTTMPVAHPCVLLHPSVQPEDPLYSYGYSENYPHGDSVTLAYEGEANRQPGEPLMKFKQGEIVAGFSGAPLLNLSTGGVCGLVKLTRGPGTSMGGRGIATSMILKYFPQLDTWQKAFHQQNRHWHAALTPKQRNIITVPPATDPPEIYYSFAQKDQHQATELRKQLFLLKRAGSISEWFPGEADPGSEEYGLNEEHLKSAKIILLFISPDYLSKHDHEIDQAMMCGAIVIPILLRPVAALHMARFAKLVRLPRNKVPVSLWTSRDAAFAEIAEEICRVVEKLRGASQA
jgi:hypothetical protein